MGLLYIGHIIEDMNSHARLGGSAGHYFRSLEGQDMSGIDIVLHQVMPGFADYLHTASCSGGVADPAFNHYVLGQLGASLAHLYPGEFSLYRVTDKLFSVTDREHKPGFSGWMRYRFTLTVGSFDPS